MTTDFERLLTDLKPLLGHKAESLRTAHTLGTPETKRAMEAWLQVQALRLIGKGVGETPPLLPPPAVEHSRGPFTLGTALYHERELHPVGIDERALMSHIGVFGRTGTGKTNFCLALLKQLHQRKIPFLILDWKRNYRDLLVDTPDLHVFTVGRDIVPFSFQPLIPPPGTSPTIWLKLLIDVTAGAYYVGEGVKYLLMKAIDAVYRETGVYAGTLKAWPTFRDVLAWLEDYRPANARESQWMISTLRTVQSLCYGEMGRVINTPQQTPIDQLLRQNVVLELDALTQTDKAFLSEALLLWIHHYRMQEGGRETLKHLIVIEEAHHVLKEVPTGTESIMEVTLREIRELGQAILLIDQTPSQIAPTALANTATKVFLNLPHRTDINTAAAALLLNDDQKEFLGKLPVGTAIVKLQERHFTPFLIRIPLVRIQKGKVSDENLRQRFRIDSTSSSTPSASPAATRATPPLPATAEGAACIQQTSISKEGASLSKEERLLIDDVLSRLMDGVHTRYRRLKVSTRRGQQAKEGLLQKGLLEAHDVALPRGKVTLLWPTEAGRRLGKKLGLPLPPPNIGPVHEFWRRQTVKTLEAQGYAVEREVRIPGDGRVDLCATRGSERLAVEIETGAGDTKENVRKVLHDGFTGLVVVAVTPEATRKSTAVMETLTSKEQQRVRVWTAQHVFQRASA